ncbi:MAG: membrane-associated zinc metalloprotease [Ruminococcus sp.]|nr:membrane-associated zinc metalloprotease [Ruminococcus sp.]
MGYVIAILIFGLIVTVHEFGHFICAKLCGIKVLEFSIGMGPRLLKFGKGETVYSLRLLPVGGYCAMEGEDSESDDSRSFRSQSVWKRMIVLVAGAFMNFVLGFVMVMIMTCMSDSVPTMAIRGFSGQKAEDGTVEYLSGSYEAGLRHGDIIVEMDGMHIFTTTDLSYMLGSSSTHDVEVIRNGERLLFQDVKFENRIDGGTIDFGLEYADKNIGNVLSYSGKDCVSLGRLVWLSLKDLVTGKYGAEELSGPVGVVTTIDETAQQGENVKEKSMSLIYLTALITINIGVFNLLPIPGLDGGRLLFCLIEILRRKPVKPEHEGYVHLAGMVLLFGIMIFATYNDIVRLVTGG